MVRRIDVLGAVAWQLLVVGTHAVSGCIGIAEHSRLQHGIGTGADARNHRAGTEGCLLNVLEVVVGVAVESQPTNGSQRVVLLWPDAGDVKNIPAVSFRLLWIHGLEVHRPGGVVPLLNGIVQVLDMVVRLFSRQLDSFIRLKVLDASVRLEMDLDIFEGAVFWLAELEGVVPETVDVAQRLGDTAPSEELHEAVDTFLVVVVKVPEHGRVRDVGLGMTFVGAI